MVSHWPIRDDAAAKLTISTLQGVSAGLEYGEALRAGMLELKADESVEGSSHPAIWAGFSVIAR
jgi:CHAT domain-containing protein